MNTLTRQRFFDKQVKMIQWKNMMSGKSETTAIKLFDAIGYAIGKDYVRQHPIGEMFVLDFAFIREQIAIEIDGASHRIKKQQEKDKRRDAYLRSNNWVPIRIDENDLCGYKMSFYKNLIKMVVEERRSQWESGLLYEVDIPNYKCEDYE